MNNPKAEFKNGLNDLLEFLQGKLKKELEGQGHKLTGKLINSFELQIKLTSDGLQGLILLEHYGEFVNRGIKAKNIPFGGRGSGKKVSKFIQALIGYFEKRGLPKREAKSAAFATANKQKREGMPTRSSKRFASNGRRTGFIDYTAKENERHVNVTVENLAQGIFTVQIVNEFKEIENAFK